MSSIRRGVAAAAALVLGFALAAHAQPAAPAPAPAANAEPTEQEMRDLLAAEVERMNESGGLRIYGSKPIRVRLDAFRKTGCKPYTRAFRCDGEARYSYPGSKFPAETLRHGSRYRRDDQGRWKMD